MERRIGNFLLVLAVVCLHFFFCCRQVILKDGLVITSPQHTPCSFEKAKFAAVMFHSEADEFDAVLQNLEPHMHEKWVVRLFLPWLDVESHSQLFRRTKQRVLAKDEPECPIWEWRFVCSIETIRYLLYHSASVPG